MGLEIFERAVNDLGGRTKKTLREELNEVAAGDEKALLKEIDELEKKQESAKNEIGTLESNNIALRKEREAVEKQLVRTKLTEEIEKKRKSLEKLQEDIKGKYSANNDAIIRKISREGYISFVKELVKKTQDMLEDKRKKGIIPSNTKYGLLKDLLDMGNCICERPLKKGEEAYKVIEEKMNNPQNAPEYEEAFSQMGQAASSLSEASKRFPSELGQLVKLRNQYQLDLLKVKEDLEEVDKDYDSKEYEDERELIEKRKRIDKNISENDNKIGGFKRDFDNYQKKIQELERKRQKTETENKIYMVRNKRLDLCIKTNDFLKELYDSLVNRDRVILKKKINAIFQDIIAGREDANIELEDDFRLRVNKRLHDGAIRPLARSGAESQITCIAFILSVITIAKKNLEEPGNIFSRGGEYPLILDSPFGVLAEYRKKVASTLAKFSNQLTILVAPQQWDHNIEQELDSFIGKRYVFHRSAPKKEAKTISQNIKGREYKLVEYIDGKVKTDIEEVK
jgi:DNA sulfur modification protein DndD